MSTIQRHILTSFYLASSVVISACNPVQFSAMKPENSTTAPTSSDVPPPVAPPGGADTLPVPVAEVPQDAESAAKPEATPEAPASVPIFKTFSGDVPNVPTKISQPRLKKSAMLEVEVATPKEEPRPPKKIARNEPEPKKATPNVSPVKPRNHVTPAPSRPAEKPVPAPQLKTLARFVAEPTSSGPKLARGDCAPGERLLSCMSCPSSEPVLERPQFSQKGEALFEIMARACQVENKSDPEDYTSPTREQLLKRMNRLSPKFYPDSEMSGLQTAVIRSLRSDPETLRKTFGGIYYSGVNDPTTAFETYFGISTIEARYAFCYADEDVPEGSSATFTRTNYTPLTSKRYTDCFHQYDVDQCRERPEYGPANIYRNQLRQGMTESLTNPFVALPLAEAAPRCQWERFEGSTGAQADAQLKSWITDGFIVGAESASQRLCSLVRAPVDSVQILFPNLTENSPLVLVAYRCR